MAIRRREYYVSGGIVKLTYDAGGVWDVHVKFHRFTRRTLRDLEDLIERGKRIDISVRAVIDRDNVHIRKLAALLGLRQCYIMPDHILIACCNYPP